MKEIKGCFNCGRIKECKIWCLDSHVDGIKSIRNDVKNWCPNGCLYLIGEEWIG